MEPVPAEALMAPPHDGNLANLLFRATGEFPDRVALEHLGETTTYGDLGDRVRRLAGGLRDFGLAPGDRVGVHLPNGLPFVETVWACAAAGVVATPLNPEYRRRELSSQLDHADAAAVVTSPDGAEFAEPVAGELGIPVVGSAAAVGETSLDDLAAAGEPTVATREDDDVLLQPYTSGTTGRPKGVLLTHRNLRVQVVDGVASYTAGAVRGDALVVLPMYHATGLVGVLTATATGRTVHLLRPDQWDPDLVLRKLAEHDVPAFGGVATMFVDLLETYDPDRHDLSTLLRAGQGGAKLPEPVHEAFEETFDVAVSEGYGLTETTAATHTVRGSTLGDRVGSVGQPVGHTRARIVDGDGEAVPVGEEGELLVAGPQVMAGYYDDPDATEAAFTDDGLFRTGDVAVRDEDNYYYIRGREKDMILTGGYNVYPSEVEAVLYDHPDVLEAAIFGLPDARRGETVACAVSPVEGASLSPDAVREYVLDELAPYKHPRVVEVMDELPKTGSGKIRKVELREQFLQERDGG